jgi:hypothetical protein
MLRVPSIGIAMNVPYASAQAGHRARAKITAMLERFGCENVGIRDAFNTHEVVLAFTHRGRDVKLRASAKGWAQMYLKQNPWSARRRVTQSEYQQSVLRQGKVAVSSILHDWIKGQITAIECGTLSFEAVFMPYMLTSDGRPLVERAQELLPRPRNETVVALPQRGDG